ncbi:hypothetical protein [uncultured Roseobacter sp.]|uniref:hypothetical protein n=1 Tax=uncultured Roseobacter sp. TaxID=114847 RepID=UPI002629FE76|nr:hypothetical protein [uncultured Roseobacter sp.]
MRDASSKTFSNDPELPLQFAAFSFRTSLSRSSFSIFFSQALMTVELSTSNSLSKSPSIFWSAALICAASAALL